jgi:alpha-beta hydrolase superfamily lysophospholipase
MRYQSLFHHDDHHSLHLMHISKPGHSGTPILMIHGMVEDGRIFYHKSGKGLGSFMAQQGYDVYIADLRGMGLSTPKISAASTHGQTETIQQDIPALIRFVLGHSGHKQLHLIAHSWGGVYINSALLFQPELIPKIISSTFFGSKRTVRARTFERYLKIDLIWNRLSLVASKRKGFLLIDNALIGLKAILGSIVMMDLIMARRLDIQDCRQHYILLLLAMSAWAIDLM